MLRHSSRLPHHRIEGCRQHLFEIGQIPAATTTGSVAWLWYNRTRGTLQEPSDELGTLRAHNWGHLVNPEAVMDVGLASLLKCWGKTGSQDGLFHPAVFHMLDVGHVARVLLQDPASPRFRSVLGHTLSVQGESLAGWLPYVVALHDIGKVSATFQAQDAAGKARLATAGFSFGVVASIHHAPAGQLFLQEAAALPIGPPWPARFVRVVSESVGGHHGRFQTAAELSRARPLMRYEPSEWTALRALAAARLQVPLLLAPEAWPEPGDASAAIMALSGFMILCDWLGSDERHFACEPCLTLDEYAPLSAIRARVAVEGAGFLQSTRSAVGRQFRALYPEIVPRPLQEAIDAIPTRLLSGPCLAILEAPTGEGKTEAALALAHRLAAAHGSDELYYALPTMATSNQMFLRLELHLGRNLGLGARAKLVHGQSALVEESLLLRPPDYRAPEEREASMEWYSSRKRALLAPFGVGTVDQVELAALNVRHCALRFAGLAGKVVVLDEVHAYDTYVTTVVERLLSWLRALGASVILLSATLPRRRREALAQAFGADTAGAAEGASDYPGVWLFAAGGTHHAAPPAFQPKRRIRVDALHMADDECEAKARWLLESVAEGGCACWITNTVDRAQRIFDRVDRMATPEIERALLHARFPLEERERIERKLHARYGPSQAMRKSGIVVGTQVLEQSLDLDFDVMVSDLAPIDLLLQRAGRLHRHARARPAGHAQPHLWINAPLTASGEPDLRRDRWVYNAFLLRLTWKALQDRLEGEIRLPEDYRTLVETVYGVDQAPAGSPLADDWHAFKKQEARAAQEARIRLLPEPDPGWPFTAQMGQIEFDESEARAGWIVAQTRLGEDSVTAIPLEREAGSARLPDGTLIALDRPAPRGTELRLLRRQVRVSHRAMVPALRAEEASLPALFARSPLLKGTLPLWLSEGRARVPHPRAPLVVTLDDRLGLVIEEEGG